MKRYLHESILEDLKKKIVLLTGPRQSGKTTLAKMLSGSFNYFNLDNPEHRVDLLERSWELGTNHPMGPLALADLIGLDTVLAILNVLYTGFKDPKFRPCPLLVKMVDAGYLGQKSGRGFYQYEKH